LQVLPAIKEVTKEEGAAALSQSSNSENCDTNHLMTINVHHFTAALEVVFDHKSVCSKKGRMAILSSATVTSPAQNTRVLFKCDKCSKVVEITSHPKSV
jgi:hypothetical protein